MSVTYELFGLSENIDTATFVTPYSWFQGFCLFLIQILLAQMPVAAVNTPTVVACEYHLARGL